MAKPILFEPVASPYLVPFDGSFAMRKASTEPPDDAPGKKENAKELEEVVGKLARLQMIPTQVRSMQVCRATKEDALWLKEVLDRESGAFGVRVELTKHEELILQCDNLPYAGVGARDRPQTNR